MAKEKGKKKVGKVWKWVCSIFLILSFFVYMPSFASFVFLLLGIALLPIKFVENLIENIVPGKKVLKGIVAAVIFVVGCCIAPQTETTTPDIGDISGPSISIEATIDETGDTTENTTEATSEATTEATTEPSAEATTEATTEVTTEPATESTTEPTTEPTVPESESTFEVHFIDVGQADAALVLCDGKAMLIDGGNKGDSSLLYTYLKNLGVDHLDYVVGTHAHEDHIGGIPGALNFAKADVVFCPVTSYDTDAFGDFKKTVEKQGIEITVPKTGDTFTLGRAQCTVLAVNVSNDDPNNTSIVLRVVYGNTSFLFTGDAERVVEQAILNSGVDIKSTVLKIGHHGSDSSTSYVWLRNIDPQYAVISVGEDNSYGHPTDAVLSLLRDAEITTYRTDMQGDIIMTSDGTTVTVKVEKNPDAQTLGKTVEERLDECVKDSVYNYNHKSNRILNGTLTYKIVSATLVELHYDVSDMIYTNTESKVDDVMDEILDYVIADINKEGFEEEIQVSINVDYEITEGNAPGTGGNTETEEPTQDNGRDYVVNTNTGKFHYPSCGSAKKIKESNRWDFHGTREELINMGYQPCKNCDP